MAIDALVVSRKDLGEGRGVGSSFCVGETDYYVVWADDSVAYAVRVDWRNFTPGQCYSNDTEDIIDLRDFLDEA